jgi:hypothetical protein
MYQDPNDRDDSNNESMQDPNDRDDSVTEQTQSFERPAYLQQLDHHMRYMQAQEALQNEKQNQVLYVLYNYRAFLAASYTHSGIFQAWPKSTSEEYLTLAENMKTALGKSVTFYSTLLLASNGFIHHSSDELQQHARELLQLRPKFVEILHTNKELITTLAADWARFKIASEEGKKVHVFSHAPAAPQLFCSRKKAAPSALISSERDDSSCSSSSYQPK